MSRASLSGNGLPINQSMTEIVIDADEMLEIFPDKINTQATFFALPIVCTEQAYLSEWLTKNQFTTNEMGWINWPDYNCRIFKNDPTKICFANSLHESITGYEKRVALNPLPELAIWHIKSVEKQDNRWEDGKYIVPGGENLYDDLM